MTPIDRMEQEVRIRVNQAAMVEKIHKSQAKEATMTELKDLFVPCKVCGKDTPFRQAQMCHKHLILEENIENDIEFAFEVLGGCSEELKRLRAIASRIKEYDHHNIQAAIDQRDGEFNDLYYQNSLDEAKMAQEALDEAVQLVRNV